MRPEPDHLRRILASGIQAPSAENKHYLRFQVLEDRVRLVSTDRASWVEHPHRQMLALLSYGAVVENLALRSAQLGYVLAVTWMPEPGRPEWVADFRWAASAAAADPLCHSIGSRHTNRRFYQRAVLPAETITRVSAAAEAIAGAKLLWLDDPVTRSLALKAIRLAETERFRRRALHSELFGAIRFEKGWHQNAEEWLPPAALEVEAPMRLPFSLLRHWGVMRSATRVGAHVLLGLRAGYLPCALSPHLGMILASAQREDLGNLQAGRAFQRIWLAATAEGLALQPMAAVTALVRQQPVNGWVSAGVKARLQQLVQELCGGHDEQPYLLFRLGQAAAPSGVTTRMTLEHYLD